jgi:hypothetical protein
MHPITFPKLTLPDHGTSVAPTLDHRIVDDHHESVHARLRPNASLAAVHDLKVFFTLIDVDPRAVRRRHVLEFIRVQRTSATDATAIRRRLSTVAGMIRTCARSASSITTRSSVACRCAPR